jgi:hypothetical protein
MTNNTTPGYPGSDDASLGGSTAMGTTSGTTPTSASTTPGKREEVSNLANEAGSAGKRVAGVAKDETRAVGSEARRQARRMADRVGSEVRDQAAHQQSRAASGLRGIGDEFSNMANGTGTGSGFAADVARQAGQRVGAAAQWLDERDPRSILQEVKGFARRRPGVFLAIAVGAGVVVGRLTRALAQPSDDDDAARGATTGTAGMRTATAYGTADTRAGSLGTTGTTGTTAGVPGVTGSETVVTGQAGDPLAEEAWAEGNPTTTRGGI